MEVFGEPGGVLGYVNKAAVNYRGLRVQTHDLVAGRLVARDTMAAILDQLLDQLSALCCWRTWRLLTKSAPNSGHYRGQRNRLSRAIRCRSEFRSNAELNHHRAAYAGRR
jgi:hypothetical protein